MNVVKSRWGEIYYTGEKWQTAREIRIIERNREIFKNNWLEYLAY